MVASSKTKSPPPDDTNSIDGPLSFEKVWLMFQETDKRFKETDKILTEKFQETDRLLTEKFQETDNKFKETDKKLNKLEQLFTSHGANLLNPWSRET